MALSGLADYRPDTRAGCAADKSSFETPAEDCAEDCAARASNGRSFAGPNTTAVLVVLLVVTIMSVSWIVVLSSVAAFPDTSVEVLAAVLISMITISVITLLGQSGKRCEQERGGEENCSLQHPVLPDPQCNVDHHEGQANIQPLSVMSHVRAGRRGPGLGAGVAERYGIFQLPS